MWKIIAAAAVVLLIAAFLIFRNAGDTDTPSDGSLSSPTASEQREHSDVPQTAQPAPALSSPAVTAPAETGTNPETPRKITKSTTGTTVVLPGGVQKTTP